MRVLVLCTANQCRSPMAAALLRARRPDLDVTSAGRLDGGVGASRPAVDVLAARGLALADHRSTRCTREAVADADLVLAMAREHVRDAVMLDRAAFAKAFTLKELVRRGRTAGPRGDRPLAAWLGEVGRGRTPQQLLGSSADDDVADPIGRSAEHYRRTAAELEALVDDLAVLL